MRRQITGAPMQDIATIPAGLLDARDRGELIICVGPELARSAGLPSPSELALTLLEDAERSGRNLDCATIRAWIDAGDVHAALEALEWRMGARYQRIVERELGELGRPLPALARAIAALEGQLRAVYTTGVDRLLERAFADAWPSFSSAQGDLIRRRKLIVKLCGTLEFPETWVLTRAALEREFGERSMRRQLLAAAYRAHCLLFVGFDPAEPLSERLFSILDASRDDEQLPSHFVVVEQCALEERARLERRGLLVLTGNPLTLLELLAGTSEQDHDDATRQLPACPYPGLQAFDQSLERVFHGRRAEVSAAASRLGGPEGRHRRWLAIEGSSGVGKSSFVHAGLIPALRRGFAEGTPLRWQIASMRPGRQPLHALADALALALAPESSTVERLWLDVDAHHDVSAKIAEYVRDHRAAGTALLLVIDQLEELVTVAAPTERSHFAACLAVLLEQRLIYLVTTLRSDFSAAISAIAPELARLLNEQASRYTLAPISRVGLRAAIAEPAAQLGVRFEAELVERIASDAEQHLGRRCADEDGVVRTDDAALPLVAHVLRGLWDARAAEDGEICFVEYEALGGVSGALSRSADALLASLDHQQRARAKSLLLHMVSYDGGRLTRRTLNRGEALALAGGDQDGERLLHLLSGGGGPRLIVVRSKGADIFVDLVHEALLREWNTLCGWIAADRAQLARDEALARRAAAWIDQGRPWRSLPRGPERRELLRGRARGTAAADQHEYQRAMRTAGWLRGGTWVLFCAALGASGHWVVEQLQRAEAVQVRQQVQIDEARGENEQTKVALGKVHAEKERLVTREAIERLLQDSRCRQALEDLLNQQPMDAALLGEAVRCEAIVAPLATLGSSEPVTTMAIDPAHEHAWIARADGSVGRWSLRNHQLDVVAKFAQAADALQISPDGERIAVRSNGQVYLIDRRGESLGKPCNGGLPSFSPDGRHVAVANGRAVELRRSADASLVWQSSADGKVVGLKFSPRGDHLIVGRAAQAGSSLAVFEVATGMPVGEPIDIPKYLRDMDVSADGEYVASTADDKYTRLFSLTSRQAIASPLWVDVREPTRRFVSFSPSGALLLTASNSDGFAVLGDDLVELAAFDGADARVLPQFSPGEQWLLTAGFDANAALREATTGSVIARLELGDRADALLFHSADRPKRTGILIRTENGELLDWAVDGQDHWRAAQTHGQGVRSLAFSPQDSRRLLSGSSDGSVSEWSIGADQHAPISLPGWIMAVGTSRGGDHNFAFSDRGTIFSWSSSAEPHALASTCASRQVALSGASERLAIACGPEVQLYDLAQAEPEQIGVVSSELTVNAIALSNAGDRLALGGSDGTIELVRVAATPERERLEGAHAGAVTGLSFDQHGQFMVSGGNDDVARLWTLDGRQKPPRELAMSGNNVESVAVSNAAKALAAGDEHGTIIVWNFEAVEQHRFERGCIGGRVYALSFAPDGELLAAGCSDGSVHAWPLGQQAQRELACERLANTTDDLRTLPAVCRHEP